MAEYTLEELMAKGAKVAPTKEPKKKPGVLPADPIETPESEERAPGSAAALLLGAGQGSTYGLADEAVGAVDALGAQGKQLLQKLALLPPDEHVSDEIQQPGVLVTAKMRKPAPLATLTGSVKDAGFEQAPKNFKGDPGFERERLLYREAPSYVRDSGPAPDKSVAETYRQGRDSVRKLSKDAQNAHEGAYLAGELGGALLAPAPKVAPAAKGASLLSRVPAFAKQGALMGGAFGFGKSEADNAADLVGDTEEGALFGAGTGAVLGPAIEKGGSAAADYLRRSAADKAFRAMSGNANIADRARQMGLDEEDMVRLGRVALDEGMIPVMGNAEKTLNRATAAKNAAGERIGNVVNRADGSWRNYSYNEGWSKVQDALEKESGLAEVAAMGPAKKFQEGILAQQAKTPGKFSGARELKTLAQDAANFSDEASLAPKVHRRAVSAFAKNFQDQVEDALGSAAANELRSANGAFGDAADIASIAQNTVSRGQQQKFTSPLAKWLRGGGLLSAGGGAATMEPVPMAMGAGAIGLATLLENPALRAHVYDVASKGLKASSPAIAEAAPKLTSAEAKLLLDFLRGNQFLQGSQQ